MENKDKKETSDVKVVQFEMEQLFDVWSLVFCIVRMHVCNSEKEVTFGNQQYKSLCGYSIT